MGKNFSVQSNGTAIYNPTTKLKMGIQKYSYRSFHGKIDEIRLYNRALNASEVYALYGAVPPANGIDNIQITQRNDGSGLLDIYYSLEGENAYYDISVLARFSQNAEYILVPNDYMSGQMNNVSPGQNKHIIWDGYASHPNIFFKIRRR